MTDGAFRRALAVVAAVVVFVVTLWALIPVGAGVYYDDGVYLALARSIADGTGYVYVNLPEPFRA